MRATCRTCRRTRADVGIAGYCDPCATRKTAEYERSRAQLRADLPDGCDVLADACADALSMPRITVKEANAEVAAMVADSREQLDPPAIAPECPRCGQQSTDYLAICDRCRSGDRETQGTQDRLFTPTAAPISGQLDL